jgi:hypothetical protein
VGEEYQLIKLGCLLTDLLTEAHQFKSWSSQHQTAILIYGEDLFKFYVLGSTAWVYGFPDQLMQITDCLEKHLA